MNRQDPLAPVRQRPLKVLMLPTFRHANPYGRALVESIRRQGVDLRAIDRQGKSFPLKKILGMMKGSQLDVVHLHWIDAYAIKQTWWRSLFSTLIYLASLAVLRKMGVTIVWTVHDIVNLNGRLPALDRRVRQMTARLAHALIVHTQAARREITALYRLSPEQQRKIAVIAHGAFVDRYPNTASPTTSRARFGFEDDHFVFGLIGYLRPYKGVLPLVEAFRELQGNRVRLLIAGLPLDKAFGDAVARACAGDSRIHLHLGFIERDDMQFYLNAVDAVALPFQHGLTSGSLILAMSFAKAVVLSSAVVSHEEVLPAGGGLVYDVNDARGLADALRAIQTLDVTSMGQANLAQVQSFDWPAIAKATVRLYQGLE